MVSVKCTYFIGTAEDAGKFKFGGSPEGTLEISESGLAFFKKSKAIALAFGAIGSAIAGKGKEDETITRDQIVSSDEKTNKRGEYSGEYSLKLKDGRIADISFLGLGGSKAGAINAMHAFLK